MAREREFLVIHRIYASGKKDAANRACARLNEGGEPDATIDLEKITVRDAVTITSPLREKGYAVVVWTPKELAEASPRRVEDRLIELGWDMIEQSQ